MTLSMARSVCLLLVWLAPWHVLVPSSGHVPLLLLSLLLNFKVNISDRIGEQVQTDNSRDKELSTSGIWPFIEYTQYKKMFASKDQLGNF